MKTNRIIRRISVFALLAMLIVSLCGCSGGSIYPNADKYTPGDAVITDAIDTIDIEWSSGSVTLEPQKKDSIEIVEKCTGAVSESMRVHHWVDGKTLRIRFCASGKALSFTNTRKDLTVKVPESVVFTDVTVTSTSAELTIGSVKTANITAHSTSGPINISAEAENFMLNSTSGRIGMKQSGKADRVLIDTTSGPIDAELDTVGTLQITSTSGSVNLTAEAADSFSATTTSGPINAAFGICPPVCAVHSTSGSVNLALPADCGFTAKVGTTSGTFNSDFAMKQDGKQYVCGDGSAELTLNTTSGTINLTESN